MALLSVRRGDEPVQQEEIVALLMTLALIVQDDMEARIQALIPRLEDDEYSVRAAAQDELHSVVSTDPSAARDVLRELAGRMRDPEVRSALVNELSRIPPLVLTASVERIRVGQPMRLSARLANEGFRAQRISTPHGGQAWSVELKGPDGKILESIVSRPRAQWGAQVQMDARFANQMRQQKAEQSFYVPPSVSLEPGEEVDPLTTFGPSVELGLFLSQWRPDRPGNYSLRLALEIPGSPRAEVLVEFAVDQ
jgi:hypothetical protein